MPSDSLWAMLGMALIFAGGYIYFERRVQILEGELREEKRQNSMRRIKERNKSLSDDELDALLSKNIGSRGIEKL